ncbi:uncharacterized protein%2C YkwD family [uncultured Ruminococcus sp.]|uniref:CAP domain-containing protein n=1 Tax=Huintestinicola butyrica TaxID=2981728 RepID=UPI000820C131|nr:CAP domain-containing protein [Huintestinicola butyrica]MCU6728371.1 CAP domain-containing protein [Huintestinicola butyrica]SCJ11499.1 uncharacterized protein%2C YkwD family [uncultured Ruminococcus sp.]
MKKLVSLLICVIMTVGFFGTGVSAVQKIGLTRTSITLEVGETATLKLSGAKGKTKWRITDASVCKYKNGIVTAVGEGKAYIYATNNGKKYKCTVTVTAPEESVTSYDPDSFDSVFSMEMGERAQVDIMTTGYGKIKVRNEDPNIISVSCGTVTDGSFTLYVDAEGVGVAMVTVYDSTDPSEYFTLGFVVSSWGSEAQNDFYTDTKADILSSDEFVDEVIRLVNEERAAAGLDALEKNDTLCTNADKRAREVAKKFSHTRPDGTKCFTAITISFTSAAENIAKGQTSPAEVMDSWMNSDGHRKNILSPDYCQIGVGYDEASGSWVQIFTD